MLSRYLITPLLILFALTALASPQRPDYIIYKKDTIATYNLLVEQYLKQHEKERTDELFGLSFRDGASFNCWRGYQAIYQIQNDSLFLTDMIDCGSLRYDKPNRDTSTKRMLAVFKDKVVNGRVFIDWYSGSLNFPLGGKILRWDGVFNTTYENETVLEISRGRLLKAEKVNNYVDAPDGIDRRYGDTVSSVLFKELQKIKWKKECDCSEKFYITIGPSGKVSKVVMADYQTAAEIEKAWEKEEYNYCIKTVLRALKRLKFDIVKSKGVPIAEDVYLWIWITDDGKLENWSR